MARRTPAPPTAPARPATKTPKRKTPAPTTAPTPRPGGMRPPSPSRNAY